MEPAGKRAPRVTLQGRVKVLLITGSALLCWVFLAWVIVPAIIADAYRGESLDIFNNALSGRAVFPLEHYLAFWATLRMRALTLLLAFSALAVLYSLAGAALRERLAPVAARIGGRDPFIVRPRQVPAYALSIGAVAGLLEFAGLHLHSLYSGRPPWPSSPFALWLTPVANILALLLVLVIAAPLLIRWPRARSVPVLVSALTFLSVLAVLRVAVPAIHPIAAGALAAGLAIQFGRLGASRGPATDRLIGRSAPLLAGLVTLLFIGQQATAAVRERSTLSRVAAAGKDAPNVLILLLDTVRARNLSLYGYERDTSPELERIAENGVVFERAAATSSWSLPSHASLFTGRYHPELTGALTATLDDEVPTLAEVLTAGGYRTGAFFANQLFGKRYFGLDRGFVHHETKPLSVPLLVQDSWILRGAAALAARFVALQVRESGAEINRRILRWLDQDPGRPFFVFANYFDVHEPMAPPPPFDTMYWPVTPRGWYSGQNWPVTDEEHQELLAAYDGAVTYVDFEVGRLLREMEARDLTRNTLIVVLSDHGENLGEHDLMGHGIALYMATIRVPLLFSFPGRVAAGRRVPNPVSLRSVPATVLDLLGIDHEVPGIPGPSFAACLRPTETCPDASWSPVYSQLSPQTPDPETQPEWMPTRYGELKSLLWEDYHYILRGDGKEELYDLVPDPFERVNLADSTFAMDAVLHARQLMDSISRLPAETPF